MSIIVFSFFLFFFLKSLYPFTLQVHSEWVKNAELQAGYWPVGEVYVPLVPVPYIEGVITLAATSRHGRELEPSV